MYAEIMNKKVIVLASGEGTNFSAIIESGIKIDMLLTNNPNANVINRAIEMMFHMSIYYIWIWMIIYLKM